MMRGTEEEEVVAELHLVVRHGELIISSGLVLDVGLSPSLVFILRDLVAAPREEVILISEVVPVAADLLTMTPWQDVRRDAVDTWLFVKTLVRRRLVVLAQVAQVLLRVRDQLDVHVVRPSACPIVDEAARGEHHLVETRPSG